MDFNPVGATENLAFRAGEGEQQATQALYADRYPPRNTAGGQGEQSPVLPLRGQPGPTSAPPSPSTLAYTAPNGDVMHVSAAQLQQLRNVDAQSGMAEEEKAAHRQQILGQAPLVPTKLPSGQTVYLPPTSAASYATGQERLDQGQQRLDNAQQNFETRMNSAQQDRQQKLQEADQHNQTLLGLAQSRALDQGFRESAAQSVIANRAMVQGAETHYKGALTALNSLRQANAPTEKVAAAQAEVEKASAEYDAAVKRAADTAKALATAARTRVGLKEGQTTGVFATAAAAGADPSKITDAAHAQDFIDAGAKAALPADQGGGRVATPTEIRAAEAAPDKAAAYQALVKAGRIYGPDGEKLADHVATLQAAPKSYKQTISGPGGKKLGWDGVDGHPWEPIP